MALPHSCARVFVGPDYKGSCFFIDEDIVVTCAHCVEPLPDDQPLTVRYGGQDYDAVVVCKQPDPAQSNEGDEDFPHPDLAVLRLSTKVGRPVTLVDVNPGPGPVSTFGFPSGGLKGGEPCALRCDGLGYGAEGFTRERYTLTQGELREGFSGAPLAQGDGRIFAVVVAHNRPGYLPGGLAVPISFLRDCAVVKDYLPQTAAEQIVPQGVPMPELRAVALGTREFSKSDIVSPSRAASSQLEAAMAIEAEIEVTVRETPGVPESSGVLAENDGARMAGDPLLDEVSKLRLRGYFRSALRLVEGLTQSSAFEAESPTTQARALRARATLAIEVEHDIERAGSLADRARALDPDAVDQKLVDAMLVKAAEGPMRAFESLTGSDRAIVLQRAGFLLEANLALQCRELIESLGNAVIDQDAKAQRLLSRSDLLTRQRQPALTHLANALSLDPDNVWNLFLATDVYIHQAIPDALWPTMIQAWIQPLRREYQLDTTDTRGYLAKARSIVDHLLTLELHESDKAVLRIEKLAANAFDPTRLAYSEELARDLVTLPHPDHRAVHWIRQLDFKVDVASAIAYFRQQEELGQADAEVVLLLATESLRTDDGETAEALLHRNEHLFEQEQAHFQWHFFVIDALISQRKFEDARGLALSKLAGHDAQTEVLAMISKCEADAAGDRVAIKTLLEKRYTEEGNVFNLLSRCDIAATEGDWSYIAEHKGELIRLGTAKAVRLVLYALYNTQMFVDAVKVYQQFIERSLVVPSDALKVYAFALSRLGDPQALAALKELVSRDPTEEHVFALARMQALTGDFAALEVTSRLFIEQGDIAVETAIYVAAWLRLQNRDIARVMWRRALEAGVPDQLVALAYTLGHQLGLESELEPLREPMRLLGEERRAGIMLMSQAEGLERLREGARQAADLGLRYRRGEIPAHFMCGWTNVDLIRTHYEIPRRNRELHPREWTPVFVRHGSRRNDKRRPTGKPLLDATSYLLADSLGILELMFDEFGEIMVPVVLPQIIAMAADNRADTQPVKSAAKARVLERIEEEHTVRVASPGSSDREDFLVDWVIDARSDDGAVPSPPAGVLTPRRVVEVLSRRGLITRDLYQAALETIGPAGGADIGPDPEQGATIRLHFNTVEVLEEAGILGVLARHYTLLVDGEWVTYAKRDTATKRSQSRLSESLRTEMLPLLARRYQAGVVRYVAGPTSEESMHAQLEATSLLTMAAGPIGDADFVVCDDRYASSQPSRDDLRAVFTLYDVLQIMRDSGGLDTQAYYIALDKMRSSGLFYLPVAVEEVLYHLEHAVVDGHTMTETAELRTLRRYIAASLLDREALAPTDAQGPAGVSQVAFLYDAADAVREAIARLLLDNVPDANVRADWALLNLSIDGYPGYGITSVVREGEVTESVVDMETSLHLGRLTIP